MAKREAGKMEKLRDLDNNELNVRQGELAEQIFRLRFQLSTGQAEGLKKLHVADLNKFSSAFCEKLATYALRRRSPCWRHSRWLRSWLGRR